jgi:hypothetical protein
VKPLAALAIALLLGCSRGQQEKHAAAPRAAAPVDAGPPATSTAGADISWLVGTWERKAAPKDWLLFNAPKEVAVISGKPPTVTARGEFAPAGRSISIFIRGPGGALTERVFEASADHSELQEQGTSPATYRRGAPP